MEVVYLGVCGGMAECRSVCRRILERVYIYTHIHIHIYICVCVMRGVDPNAVNFRLVCMDVYIYIYMCVYKAGRPGPRQYAITMSRRCR